MGRKLKISAAVCAVLAAAALITAVIYMEMQKEAHTRLIFAMDTCFDLTAYGTRAEKALDDAEAEIVRLDALLSARNGTLAELNAAGGGEVPEELAELLEKALALCSETDGAFDITLLPLSEAWDFTGSPRVPDADEIAGLLKRTGAEKVSLSGCRLELEDGVRLDLGAIAKGYAADRVARVLAERGVDAAVISLGGNVRTLGIKPDGSPWRIGVTDPAVPAEIAYTLETGEISAVTSGAYQRYFECNGVRYGHILDPRTGCPAQTDLASVTVLCTDGARADALSTALYIMGSERAKSYRTEHGGFDMLLIYPDGTVEYIQ